MRYTTIRIPRVLVTELLEIGRKTNQGYSSAADAVKDAIRDKIEELRRILSSLEEAAEVET